MPPDALVVGSTPVLAIVRFHEGGDVDGTLDALVRGGIEVLEITIDTPGALDAVESSARAGRTVGVGTVLTGEQVRASAAAGARFVVSPGVVPEVVEVALELGLEALPGVFTPTEVLTASATGAKVMKLFPASSGGPDYLRALRGPFPALSLVPTGGVRIDDIPAYLEAGARAVAVGGELVGRAAPRSDRELDAIAERARSAVAAARSARAQVMMPGGTSSGEDGRSPTAAMPVDNRAARH